MTTSSLDGAGPRRIRPVQGAREPSSGLDGYRATWRGRGFYVTGFPYPYRTDDGREEADVSADVQRVARGGAWYDVLSYAAVPYRGHDYPGFRDNGFGLRAATSDSIAAR